MEKIIHSTSAADLLAVSIEIRLVVTIFEPVIPPGVHGDDTTSLVDLELTVRHDDGTAEFKHAYSLWSDALDDILNLSICLHHFSLRDDTTEILEDQTLLSTYPYPAQWAIEQSLFNIGVSLFSKNTKKFLGKRYMSLIVYPDADCSGVPRIVGSAATPEEVRRFASELHACYDQVMSARALFLP
jgi:hypothetical protein